MTPILRLFVLVFGISMVAGLAGCEDGETRDLAKAQACLNEVPQDNPGAASNCYSYVENYSSQQANILKCSIKLTSGGLSTQKIVDAYKVTDDSTVTNKQAVFIGFLSLNLPSAAAGYVTAKEAYPFCELSQVSGLKFIGGLAKMASMLASLPGVDLSDPNDIETEIGAALEGCVDGSQGTCDLEDTGATVVAISESYCSSPSSDKDVCGDINEAIAEAGGDPIAAAKQFMCKLQKKTLNPAGTACI